MKKLISQYAIRLLLKNKTGLLQTVELLKQSNKKNPKKILK